MAKTSKHVPPAKSPMVVKNSANEMVNITTHEPEVIVEAPVKLAEPPKAPVMPKVFPKFRVKKTKQTSLYGQMVTMHEGDILDSSGYGMPGIQNLIEGGVELEEVK